MSESEKERDRERERTVPDLFCSRIPGHRWCAAHRCSAVTNLFLLSGKEVEEEKEHIFMSFDVST